MMKNLFKYITMLLAGLLFSVSCNSKVADNKSNEPMNANNGEKVLIVFFSHAGENYGVGNIEVGNTKLVVDEIRRVTGGTEFEIVAEKSYDMPYDALTKLAQEEAANHEKPAYKGDVEHLDQYDTVFIGGPIWWGTYPQVMFTFFDQHDLNGKTIIPFSTHEGSGLGNVVDDLKRLYPEAHFKTAFSIYGHECRKDLSKVDQWLKGLGYKL